MALKVTDRMEENVGIIELSGKLTSSPALFQVRNVVKRIFQTPALSGLILDVDQVTSIDSSGLGELTNVYMAASKHGCNLRLVGVGPTLKKMLETTHLDKVLLDADHIDSAKRQFRASA